jgi:hypothetical protein
VILVPHVVHIWTSIPGKQCVCTVELNGTISPSFSTAEMDDLYKSESHADRSNMWKSRDDTDTRAVYYVSRQLGSTRRIFGTNLDMSLALAWVNVSWRRLIVPNLAPIPSRYTRRTMTILRTGPVIHGTRKNSFIADAIRTTAIRCRHRASLA